MLITTITVEADQTASEAVVRMAGLPDQAYVVVRRRDGIRSLWYTFRAGLLRRLTGQAPRAVLSDVLNLREAAPSRTLRPDEALSGSESGVVLDGEAVVGIVVSDGTSSTRGGPFVPAGPGGEPHRPPGGGDSEGPFTAYPQLECPDQVVVGERFELIVRLADEESRETGGGLVQVDTDLKVFDLIVSVVAPGFSIARTRDILGVDRSDLSAGDVRFSLTADALDGVASSTRAAWVQVDFSFGGQICGRAWRAVFVASDADAPSQGANDADPPRLVATGIRIIEAQRPADLEMTITANIEGTELEWQFFTPHEGIAIPDTPVRKRFQEHYAKSFAMQQIRLIHESIGGGAVGNRVLGTARTIADEIPPQAWQVLSDVWRVTSADGRRPSVLLVSTDAYVPWELASTEAQYIDEELTDKTVPPILGAQIGVSRWNAPQPRGFRGVLNPQLPPPEAVEVRRMALVVGDYLAINGTRPLPKAKEEGNILSALYKAVMLSATLEQIDPMFDGELRRDGQLIDPDVVHFACHGQIDPNPGFNGIVLNEGNARLDSLYVAGNKMRNPFVFLNACQVGQNTELLDGAGGLATSFLKTGATGFIAPLWNVDDQIAQDTAVEFYRAAFEERTTVAEVLRRRRALFDPKATTPETTHLAYIYYGHPNLLLSQAG